jgi:hypothetical protein
MRRLLVVDGPDSGNQLVVFDVLEKIAYGPGLNGLSQIVAVKGQDDDVATGCLLL